MHVKISYLSQTIVAKAILHWFIDDYDILCKYCRFYINKGQMSLICKNNRHKKILTKWAKFNRPNLTHLQYKLKNRTYSVKKTSKFEAKTAFIFHFCNINVKQELLAERHSLSEIAITPRLCVRGCISVTIWKPAILTAWAVTVRVTPHCRRRRLCGFL